MKHQMTWSLLAFLIAINLVQPMSIDLYLPVLDKVQNFFHCNVSAVESTLSIFLLGLGLGQLVFGALSDYYGRKYVFLLGGSCFCIATIACIHSDSIHSLIIFRFLQAFAAGVFVNTANAVIRDVCDTQQKTIFYLGILNGTLAFSPGLAPVLGLLIMQHFDWSGVFMFLTLFAGFLMAIGLLIPETHERNSRRLQRSLTSVFYDYLIFIRYRNCIGYSLIYGLAFSSFIAYMTTSSWLWIHVMNQSSATYTFYFSVNACAFALSGFFTSYLAKIGYKTGTLLKLALTLILVSGLILFYTFFSFIHFPIFLIVTSVFLLSFGVTMTLVSSMTKILTPFPDQAGQVSAFAQCISLLVCAGIGYITAEVSQAMLLGLPLLIISLILLAFILLASIERGENEYKPGYQTSLA